MIVLKLSYLNHFIWLNITILYESLCPDSVDFFMEQLQPAWSSLAPYTNFTYVPFGKAYCFKKVNLHEWKVRQCENSDIGNSLQLLAENITHRFNPEFIPTILFNDLYFRSFQNMALMDFKHAACKFFPPGHVACI
ncbi:uncharacterized protein LOC113370293 [Ctenocephalides felis]|uniref:uncharacterized protein LOC113370293 n=1 Tax=Ctenocephalides felis TaxID=7515 RepID=UPI000E6E32B6|nr:uncharacterized protein LOC113370293 [Ctenocephalides felis]